MNQFNNELDEWADLDIAMHILAIELGLLNEKERFIDWKGMYFVDNKIGNALGDILERLVEVNFLEYDED